MTGNTPGLACLPVEIAQEIFLYCLPHLDFSSARDKSILRLCHINSRLRAIAFGLTTLWSSISINVESLRCKQYYNISDDWLCRSGSSGLSINVEDRDFEASLPFRAATFLQKHQDRVVRLISPADILGHIHGTFPNITTLILILRSGVYVPDRHLKFMKQLRRLHLSATALSEFVHRGIYLHMVRNIFGLAASMGRHERSHTLTHLILHTENARWGELAERNCFLESVPDLELCVLIFDIANLESDWIMHHRASNPVRLQSLRSLALLSISSRSIVDFFTGLYTPSLHTLRSDARISASEAEGVDLTHFRQQIANLRRLSLLGTSPEEIGPICDLFLLRTPLLEELDLEVKLAGQLSRGQYLHTLAYLLDNTVVPAPPTAFNPSPMTQVSVNSIMFHSLLPPTRRVVGSCRRRSRFRSEGSRERSDSERQYFYCGTRSDPRVPNLRLLTLDFGMATIDGYVRDGSTKHALTRLITARGWDQPSSNSASGIPTQRGIRIFVPSTWSGCREAVGVDVPGLEVKAMIQSEERFHWEQRMVGEELEWFHDIGLPSSKFFV